MDEIRGEESLVVALDGRQIRVSVNTALEIVVLLLSDGASLQFAPEVAISLCKILSAAADAATG
jgi:hypothetical protein